MSATDRDQRLARATGYPFPAPPHSYLFVDGVAHEIVEPGRDPVHDGRLRDGDAVAPAAELLRRLDIAGAARLDDRVPVIAHGSNASPEQLWRKFGHIEGGVVIPVIKAWLADHDVVYATHFTRYGAIPATLERSPGTSVELAVTFLSAPQLALMHDTEIAAVNYVYGRLDRIRLALDGLGDRDTAFVYLTLHGALAPGGAPLALAARPARDRAFEPRTMRAMLGFARDEVAPGMALDAFILENVENDNLRSQRTQLLRDRHARAPDFAAFEVLAEG